MATRRTTTTRSRARAAKTLATALLSTSALVAGLTVVLVVALGWPATAAGRPNPDAQYYGSIVTGIQPALPGLQVTVRDAGATITLTNGSGKDVVVLGYAGEDYLRITGDKVQENSRSLSAALNKAQGSSGAGIKFSGQGKPKAANWVDVSQGNSYTWHDYRTRWGSAQRPPSVVAEPHRAGQVFPWGINLKVDGQPALVRGAVTWSGTPLVSTKLKLLIAVAVLVVLLLIVMMMGRGRRRRARRSNARVLERAPVGTRRAARRGGAHAPAGVSGVNGAGF